VTTTTETHRYPHVDEYEGDGYDDYSRTMQDTWEDDSPFHRDYEYDEKEFKGHYAFSVSGHQHSTANTPYLCVSLSSLAELFSLCFSCEGLFVVH
jgi:hypothetical protein